MKYMHKALSVLSLLAIMAGFTACNEDEALTEVLNSEQVYFPNTMSTTVEITADASSVEIPVMRMGTDAVEIPVVVEAAEENSLDLQVPAKVAFAEGSKESKIVITYNPEKVTPGSYDKVKLSFGNDYNTPYGNAVADLKIGQAEPWVSLGICTIYDDFWMGQSYRCEILQNELDPQSFRLVKPFPAADYDRPTELLEFRIYKAGETLLDEVLEQDVVYWDYKDAVLTYYDSDGDFIHMAFPGLFKSMATQDSWTHNTVLSYQENGLPAQVQFAPLYYEPALGSGWNYSQSDGMFVITFPGVVVADYSAEVSYAGKYENADGEISAVANVELGGDVASAKAAVVAGRNNMDGVNGIVDGSLENIVDFTASGEIRIPMPAEAESGTYTIAVVTYDAEGEAQDYNVANFNYSASGEVKETWTPVFLGNYTYKYVFCNNDGTPYVDEGLTLYESDVNENRYKIENAFNGVDFIFEMDEEGYLTFEDQYSGYTDASAGDLMFCDMNAMYPDNFPTKSYYSNGEFYFNIGFYANDGWWGYDQSDDNDDLETFTLTANAAKAKKTPAKNGRKNVKRPVHAKKNIIGKPAQYGKVAK